MWDGKGLFMLFDAKFTETYKSIQHNIRGSLYKSHKHFTNFENASKFKFMSPKQSREKRDLK
jgi:hypothetical protein